MIRCELYRVNLTKIILFTKTTATQNEVAPSYHKVRGLYIQTVDFARTLRRETFRMITVEHKKINLIPTTIIL